MNWCLFYQAEWNFPKIIESIIGITLWIEIQPKIIFFLPPSFQGEMPSKCWKWNSYWSHRLSDLLHPTIGQNFCPIQTDTSLKKKKKSKYLFDLTLKSIVNVKNTETVDCELFIMLEGAFWVVLFVCYEATLYACGPFGTLMKRRYFISPLMPVNEFCKINTIYKDKSGSRVICLASLRL